MKRVNGTGVGCGVVSVVAGLLAGCELFVLAPPPVVCYGIRGEIGPVAGYHSVAGVYVDVLNQTEQAITRIEVGFYLFDGDGLPAPAIGGNYFTAVHDLPLAAGERREICLSVDEAFYYAPSPPLGVRRFAFSRITFADGSSWDDPYGRYLWDSDEGE